MHIKYKNSVILGGISIIILLGVTFALDNPAFSGMSAWFIPPISCDPSFGGQIIHLDKIWFHVESMSLKDPAGTIIGPFVPLDIKVLDFPDDVVDLRVKVSAVLTDIGFTRGNGALPIFPGGIVIDDVEYAVACGLLP